MPSKRCEGAGEPLTLRNPVPAAPRPAREAKTRVSLLSDVRLYREGLHWCLARQPAFEILDVADLSAPAVVKVVARRPDVIVLDVGAPDSLPLAKSFRISLPNTKIIAFAVSEIDHLMLACAEAGISGYVAPDGSEQDLVTAIEFALRGELFCPPRIAGLLLRRVAELTSPAEDPHSLTPLTRREHQILALIGEGMSNKEIGRVLRIVEATVKNHVHNILEKLQVHRRGEAAVRLRAMHAASGATLLMRRQPAPGGSTRNGATP